MVPPRLRTLLGLILLAAAACWLLWPNEYLRKHDTDAESSALGGAAKNAANSELDAAPEVVGTGVMPPSAEPVRSGESPPIPSSADLAQLNVVELLDLLGDRARAGDPVAACELTSALEECRFLTYARDVAPTALPAHFSEFQINQQVEFHAQLQERRDRAERRCVGVSPGALAEAVRLNAYAALAGHEASLSRFIWAPSHQSAAFLRDQQLANMYRTQLWSTLRRAFAAGNAELAYDLLTVMSSPNSPLPAALPEAYSDQEAAVALMVIMVNEAGTLSWSGPHSTPSPEATETARRWIDELFGGRLPKLSSKSPSQLSPEQDPTCDSDSAWLPRLGRAHVNAKPIRNHAS